MDGMGYGFVGFLFVNLGYVDLKLMEGHLSLQKSKTSVQFVVLVVEWCAGCFFIYFEGSVWLWEWWLQFKWF